jgi:hypothetical protein
MTRFASALIRHTDDVRTREIAAHEAGKVARDFAPVRAQIDRNIATAQAANKRYSLY